ncbi:hypothetical protein VISP3789_16978 [Vibrio splendidus ATCC 33789]|nr:hypothetical protein VISP3789_16978 [Vibrio splendidus ATCC 33789]
MVSVTLAWRYVLWARKGYGNTSIKLEAQLPPTATDHGGFFTPVLQPHRKHTQPTENALLLPTRSVFDLIFSQFYFSETLLAWWRAKNLLVNGKNGVILTRFYVRKVL